MVLLTQSKAKTNRSPPNRHKKWLTCFKELGKIAEKRWQCRGCDFRAKSKVEVQRHYAVHLDEAPFACNVPGCRRRFTLAAYLTRHKKIHEMKLSDEMPIACDVTGCDFKTRYKCALDRHKLIKHSDGKKPFACPVSDCSYRAKCVGDITKHKKVHDPNRPKPFKCPLCQDSFYRNGHLLVHILTHTKEGAHKCPYCPYSAPFESRLARHVCPNNPDVKSIEEKRLKRRMILQRSPAKNKKHKCDVCEFTTDYIARLKKHQLKVHRPRVVNKK